MENLRYNKLVPMSGFISKMKAEAVLKEIEEMVDAHESNCHDFAMDYDYQAAAVQKIKKEALEESLGSLRKLVGRRTPPKF